MRSLTCAAAAIAATLFAMLTAWGRSCPNKGVEFVPAEIKATGEQDCPTVVIGVGIPGIGIFGARFGASKCPTAETWVGAHHDCVEKKDYSCVEQGTYVVKEREVTCNTKANLIVIGTGNCSKGPWMNETSLKDYDEAPCTGPPPQ